MNCIRACAAIIRDGQVVMVRHREKERTYWTLPGGKVEPGESPKDALIREVLEETGLRIAAERFLFSERFKHGVCECHLARIEDIQEPALGHDPEEAGVKPAERLLQEVAWKSIEAMREDKQVARVIESMGSLDR